jgi:dTDP-4-amino-4,6-dideoxygalactose transaminase
MIHLSPPPVFPEMQIELERCLQEGYLSTMGPHLERFEKGLEAEIKKLEPDSRKRVLVLNSGTAALHLALRMLGVDKGDLVICQSLTFVACAGVIKYLNADAIFVDSEQRTWNMDSELLEKLILRLHNEDKKVKAILVVDMFGMPFDSRIQDIALRYNIPLVEDAAEALGALSGGSLSGCQGDYGIWSFNGNKILSTAGGGALICPNDEAYERAFKLATQAKEATGGDYLHKELGYNYRMSNLNAALGYAQIGKLKELVEDRKRIFNTYRKYLSNLEWQDAENTGSNRWLSVALFENRAQRDRVQQGLKDQAIESRPVWRPMHLQPLNVDQESEGGAVAENLFERGLCLPSGFGLKEAQIEAIAGCIKKAMG